MKDGKTNIIGSNYNNWEAIISNWELLFTGVRNMDPGAGYWGMEKILEYPLTTEAVLFIAIITGYFLQGK